MPLRDGIHIDLLINSKLVPVARRAAKQTGIPLRQFLAETIEAALAERRCRALPPVVPRDPNPIRSPASRR